MTVRRQQYHDNGVYFITFTCYKWLHLFESTQSYDLIYKWFDYLKKGGSYIVGYVIMPNHVHAVIAFTSNGQSINTRVGNGKRFIAYELVTRLKEQQQNNTLQILADGVNATDRKRGKLHEVFEPSFDCKECIGDKMLKEKLDYMHNNPVKGKWALVETPIDYPHSSASFYYDRIHKGYEVISWMDLQDIDFSKPFIAQ